MRFLASTLLLFLGCSLPKTRVAALEQAQGIAPEPQRSGDAARGYDLLIHGDYIRLGTPLSSYLKAYGPASKKDTLPGRRGPHAQVRYSLNVVVNKDGMELVTPNCMSCHGYHLDGKFVLGLGRPEHFTTDPLGGESRLLAVQMANDSEKETLEYLRFLGRMQVSVEGGPFNTFASYASHRDPTTLQWSPMPHFDSRTGLVGWVDIPPLWRAKKKAALYANGMGRGDFVGHFMNMSVFSLEDVAEAEYVEALFEDIGAFLRSMEPPKFPRAIDPARAASGEAVFVANCSRCHGTYGPSGNYPTLLVPVDEVGTDDLLARRSWVNEAAADWFNTSFFGKKARMELHDGYVAPPLDGIWATAPFLHNGSVPNLEALLDSTKRPVSWRSRFQDYDFEKIGWKLGEGSTIDTRQEGLSNTGHTFGDVLSDEQRQDLIEYLKSL